MLPVLVNIARAGEAPEALRQECRPNDATPALLLGARALALTHWRHTPLRHAHTMAALMREWPLYAAALRQVCTDPASAETIERHGVAIASCQLHAPAAPGQVYCTIGNYQAQLLEAALDAGDGPSGPQAAERKDAVLTAIEKRRREGTPYICMKGSACVAGPHDELQVSADLATLDWEVEIGVVIGRTAWKIGRGEALDYVAGYCVVNDLTLRAKVFRADPHIMGTDWLQSKARPGWLPTGPWLAPAWNIADPDTLDLHLRLNGDLMQSGHAGDMVFDIAEQIAYLSQHTRLEPGDLLCTGSPAGFGSHHGRYLRPGDLVEAGVGGLGTQRVRCVS